MPRAWRDRPREEAYSFNPAYLSSLMCDFVREFTKAKQEACPITLVYLFPALSLHRQTRERFPSRTVTSLYEWIQANEDVLVDLPRRANALLPLLREGAKFALYQEVLELSGGHGLILGGKKGHFTPKTIESVSIDVRETVTSTRFLAKWFAKSGSEASILSGWGIRP
ncbi:DUF6521 family protein [Shimia thalassica]|uniref:three component ABC system middle component n=1 Tax=Shimia thalassica TaxID=1715693 RepID=UPI0027374CD5|nr:three component ABC system middle component [Shimia thalassica]MDP2496184.1 DUF6521 family protein [Shimia thalassica]